VIGEITTGSAGLAPRRTFAGLRAPWPRVSDGVFGAQWPYQVAHGR
jgi:hypothetical protein